MKISNAQAKQLGISDEKPIGKQKKPKPEPFRWERFRVPAAVPEYRFHPGRDWRFDFAWPDWMIAVEIEGGVWTKGRHTRGKGFLKDMEKYNAAAHLGWRVFRFTPAELASGWAVGYMMGVFGIDEGTKE